jgi:hypothetical protein
LAAVVQVQVRRQVQEVQWSVPMTIRMRCSVDSQKVLLLLLLRLHTLMVAVAVVSVDQP